jgi:hypothetical protein
MKPEYDCSFGFDHKIERLRYKYIVVTAGDLDINNAMLLRSKKDVRAYLKAYKDMGGEKIQAMLKIAEWIK